MVALPTALTDDSIFAEYQREFISYLSTTGRQISESETQQPEDAISSLKAADESLSEAASLLKSMELECQTQKKALRPPLQASIQTARDALASMKTALQSARRGLTVRAQQHDRDQLLGDDEERFRLLDTTRDLERGSDRILESRRHVAETEAIGAGILQDLQAQRNTIQRARNTLGNVDGGLEQSNTIINTMNRRAVLNKIIVYVVLGGIAIACLIVVYIRVFHARKSPVESVDPQPVAAPPQ